MNIVAYITQAHLIVQIILGILFLMSIRMWASFFAKNKQIARNIVQNNRIDQSLYKHRLIADLLKDIEKYSSMYANLTIRIGKCFLSFESEIYKNSELANNLLVHMNNISNESILKDRYNLSKDINYISNIVYLSPLLGLLGTICGIINTFNAININGGNNISIVAPGVSEALISTAISMFIAIQAALIYNRLNQAIEDMTQNAYNFKDTMMSIVFNLSYTKFVAVSNSKQTNEEEEVANSATKNNNTTTQTKNTETTKKEKKPEPKEEEFNDEDDI